MEITKEKVKRSLIVAGLSGGIAEYVSASIVNDFQLIVDYKFQEFWDQFNYNFSHPLSNITNALSNSAFHEIQPFILGGATLLALKVLFQKNDTYEDASNYGSYGTSRWASPSEIFDSANITTDYKKEGTILGVYKRKPIIQHTSSHLNRNTCLVGGSGAGKTASNIIPNILHNKEKSIVVIDPKGELYEKTSQTKREQGYEVRLINFKDRDRSDRYNLFDYIRRDSDAYKIAETLVNNAGEGKVRKDFWNLSQISLIQALILYVRYTLPPEQQHMGSVYGLSQVPPEQLRELFLKYEPSHIVRKSYASAMEKLQDKTQADVFSTMNATLNMWTYQDVCDFTFDNDFYFEELGQKKMIVYIIMPIADNEFRPLITTFFTQLFSELYRLADYHQGVLPKGVILYLDEFANIGKIPNFEERLSTTRSLGIEVTIVIQDTSQLDNRYGKEIAKEILNNCDIKILLKANELETAKYFSQLAGKTTIKIKNTSSSSSNKSSSKSESVNHIGRDLITADEITRLNFNEELVFLSGQYPMKVKKLWYFKNKNIQKILKDEVSRELYPVNNRGEYTAFLFKEPELKDEVIIIPDEPNEPNEELTVADPEPIEKKPDEKKEENKSINDQLEDLLL